MYAIEWLLTCPEFFWPERFVLPCLVSPYPLLFYRIGLRLMQSLCHKHCCRQCNVYIWTLLLSILQWLVNSIMFYNIPFCQKTSAGLSSSSSSPTAFFLIFFFNSIKLISIYFLNIRISKPTTTQSGFTEKMVTSHGWSAAICAPSSSSSVLFLSFISSFLPFSVPLRSLSVSLFLSESRPVSLLQGPVWVGRRGSGFGHTLLLFNCSSWNVRCVWEFLSHRQR